MVKKTYAKDINNRDIITSGYADITYDNNGGFVITDNNNMRGFTLQIRMINQNTLM
jgi:hypothetical protein